MSVKNRVGAYKAERSKKGYRTFVDQHDVIWRAQKNGEGTLVKVLDPSFTHATEPLPMINVFGRQIDVLGAASVAVVALIILLLGALLGAGLS